jgi:hypothetical protein
MADRTIFAVLLANRTNFNAGYFYLFQTIGAKPLAFLAAAQAAFGKNQVKQITMKMF